MSAKIKVEIYHPAQTMHRICENDQVGLFVAETWGKIFKKYTPYDSGTLSQSYRTKPFQVEYYQPYSHYQWEGILYLTANGSSWARYNEPKFPTGKGLNYSHEQNTKAQSHWEQAAYNDKAKEVANAITQYIARM